ncbi:MAG: hypothetical protein WCG98_04010 [bacterium]
MPDTFINHTNLTYLNLGDNSIMTLSSGAFNGLTHLTDLLIHRNDIVSIKNGAFN